MFCVLKIDLYEQGVAITLAAISLGASVIERHFTLDRQQVDNHFEVDTKKKIRNFNHLSKKTFLIRKVQTISALWNQLTWRVLSSLQNRGT